MIFIELPAFARQGLFDDESLRTLQNTLIRNIEAGPVIPGGYGLRKLRMGLPGRGKRGGARVIYYWWDARACCYLVFAYPKNVQDDLTPSQLHALAALMKEILDDG